MWKLLLTLCLILETPALFCSHRSHTHTKHSHIKAPPRENDSPDGFQTFCTNTLSPALQNNNQEVIQQRLKPTGILNLIFKATPEAKARYFTRPQFTEWWNLYLTHPTTAPSMDFPADRRTNWVSFIWYQSNLLDPIFFQVGCSFDRRTSLLWQIESLSYQARKGEQLSPPNNPMLNTHASFQAFCQLVLLPALQGNTKQVIQDRLSTEQTEHAMFIYRAQQEEQRFSQAQFNDFWSLYITHPQTVAGNRIHVENQNQGRLRVGFRGTDNQTELDILCQLTSTNREDPKAPSYWRIIEFSDDNPQ